MTGQPDGTLLLTELHVNRLKKTSQGTCSTAIFPSNGPRISVPHQEDASHRRAGQKKPFYLF